MDLKSIKNVGNAVGFTVGVDRKGVIKALKKHKISLSKNPTNKELIASVFSNLSQNQGFNKDFTQLTLNNAKLVISLKKSNYVGFSEDDQYLQDIYASADGGGTDWGGLAGSILNSGATIFGSIKQTDAQRKLAESQAQISANETAASLANNQTQLEIARLELEKAKLGSAAPEGNNKTLMYVGIGLGVLLFVGLTIIVIKSSKK